MSGDQTGRIGPRSRVAEKVIANLWNEHRHPGRRKEDRMPSEKQPGRKPDELIGGVNLVAGTVNIYMGDELARRALPDSETLKAMLPALLRALREADNGADQG